MADKTPATLLRHDQCERWQKGEQVRVESYLEQQPRLRQQKDALLDLIYNEIFLREQHGDRPQLDEYLQRFPQFGDELRMLFEVHQVLEEPSSGEKLAATNLVGPQPSSEPTAAPRRTDLPGYEVLGELGRGGMGVVYQARQKSLNRLVALKMILAGAHAGPALLTRFRAEAEAVARLQHPNIIQIYEVGDHDGLPYLSLELVDGGHLGQKLGGNPQPPQAAAELVEILARAMHYAHQRGILHRDLKPANVLLAAPVEPTATAPSPSGLHATAYGFPKVTDFGLAKQLDGKGGQTQSEAVLGTPQYMAPEQAAGKTKEIGPPADVYSLGAILYEMLTGRPPFRGATAFETLEQVRSQEVVAPRRLQAKLPRDLDSICLKCLEKAPAKRYATAEELADDLRRFLKGEPTRARPASLGQRTAKWVARRPAVAALIGVIGVALVGLVGLLAWHYVDLRDEVAQARADEKAARLREQELLQHQLQQEQARREAQERYGQFIRRRDDALFTSIYGTPGLGMEPAANLKATMAAAHEALGLAGMASADRPDALLLDRLSEAQAAEVTAGCYQLLLSLAETAARPLPQQSPAGKQEQLEQALRYLRQAADLAPPTQAFHKRRASYLAQLGRAAEADRERERARGVVPSTAMDHFLLGAELYEQRKLAAALVHFEESLRLRPDDFWSQYYLLFCFLDLHRLPEARVALTASLAQRSDFIWTYLLRGDVNAKLKAFEAAEADFQKALALHPDEDARYALHTSRGFLRLEEGKLPEAVTDLQHAVALRPRRYEPYRILAKVYHKEGKPGEALDQIEQALRCDPPPEYLAALHAERSQFLFEGKRYDDAIRASQEAARLAPGYADAYRVLGRAALERKDYPLAARALTQYLDRGGKPDPDIYWGRGWAHVQTGDYPAAVHDYTLALEHKADPVWLAQRGWAHVLCEAWTLAADDFDHALRLDPNTRDAFTGRGLARAYLGRYREAVADAQEALRRKPDTPEMMHNLACLFAQAAGKAEADAGSADHQALTASYRQQAVAAMGETLALVPPAARAAFLREKVLPDSALDPIRRSDDFAQFVRRHLGPGPAR